MMQCCFYSAEKGWIDQQYGDLILLSKFSCCFIIALNRTVLLIRSWLMASLALTRCFACIQPIKSNMNKSKNFCSKLNIIMILIYLSVFASLNILGVMMLSYDENGCKISEEIYLKYPSIEFYNNFLLGILGYCVPCFVTLISDICLICFLKSKSMIETKIISKTMTVLFISSFAYLLCYLPYSIIFICKSFNVVTIYMNELILFVTHLRYLNHILMFYIYFIMSKSFRSNIKKIFFKKYQPVNI